MFGISAEHLIVLGVVLLIFGPKKLPELGNTMGKAIKNFRDALAGVQEGHFRKLDQSSEDLKTLANKKEKEELEPVSFENKNQDKADELKKV